jgi:RNA polymerase sigma-70 factor (ECF subfamily)
LDNRTLVEGLKRGDPKAGAAFDAAYRERLRRTCGHFLGFQDPEVDDLVQETFLKALEHLDQFDFRKDLYSWLNKICVNLCFTRLHKRQRLVLRQQEDLEELATGLARREAQRREDGDEKAHQLGLLRALIKGMGKPCSRVLELRDLQGASFAAMSRSLRVPMGTVLSRLSRCRQALKQLFLSRLGETA